MSSKHTPGPWAYQEDSDAYTHIVRGPGNRFICQLAQTTSAEIEANARLIAAAPELLEALERIALPHDCGCVPCTGQCRSQIALEIAVEEMQGLARAAIAKATGGAQ